VTWPLSIDALTTHLRGIAESHPEVAVLTTLGQSAGGREILALELGARGEGAGDARPVLFLFDYQGASSAGPEAMIALAWQLVDDFGHDERVRALLAQTRLVLAPALDPDLRAVEPAPAADAQSAGTTQSAGARRARVSFERNFPSGWQPDALRAGSGRVSLSEPESLCAARTFANLRGCAVVLGFTPSAPRGQPYPGAELPAADHEVFQKLGAALELEGARPLVPWYELASGGGGPFDFAYQARGMYPFAFTLPSEEELAAGGLAPFEGDVRARVLRCLALLPRVEIAQEGLERLAPDTWQLDVRLQNVGTVPTTSALASHREPLVDVVLEVAGAKLLATARKPANGADYTDPSFQVRPPLSAGTLAGGEARWLRLMLEAASGAEVRVTASSPWAGRASLRVTLP
jgi:hypothetical protein